MADRYKELIAQQDQVIRDGDYSETGADQGVV